VSSTISSNHGINSVSDVFIMIEIRCRFELYVFLPGHITLLDHNIVFNSKAVHQHMQSQKRPVRQPSRPYDPRSNLWLHRTDSVLKSTLSDIRGGSESA